MEWRGLGLGVGGSHTLDPQLTLEMGASPNSLLSGALTGWSDRQSLIHVRSGGGGGDIWKYENKIKQTNCSDHMCPPGPSFSLREAMANLNSTCKTQAPIQPIFCSNSWEIMRVFRSAPMGLPLNSCQRQFVKTVRTSQTAQKLPERYFGSFLKWNKTEYNLKKEKKRKAKTAAQVRLTCLLCPLLQYLWPVCTSRFLLLNLLLSSSDVAEREHGLV